MPIAVDRTATSHANGWNVPVALLIQCVCVVPALSPCGKPHFNPTLAHLDLGGNSIRAEGVGRLGASGTEVDIIFDSDEEWEEDEGEDDEEQEEEQEEEEGEEEEGEA